ncbi:ubiquitin-activating E1 FCCH domain-containing protein [Brevundimonas diminuta]|uniref:ubiquitin-activating E1 FCCH domain-containing protein n=1 Tax=Brevundimonas diminuta TaxID=293 RepID=UPI003209CEC9
MLGTTADPSVRARAAGVGDTMDRLTRARAAAGLKRLTARFLRQTQGNVAMMFALALPVLLMITLGAIDIHQASKVKAQLQDALDAAALAAARSTFTDDVNINTVGLAALKANMPGYFGETSGDTANFVLLNNRVTGDARVNVKVLVANVVLPPYGKLLDDFLPVSTRSEVLRASRNVEVAMVLDITGSMKGTRMTDLKTAAKDLVDLVVQEQQSPFTSKVALVPYSMGVNAGTYANVVRGPLTGPTSISGAVWADGAARSITSISRERQAVVTAANHGLSDNQWVGLSGVSRMTKLNGRGYQVQVVDRNSFRLVGENTNGESRDGSGGTFTKCLYAGCHVAVTSANHGLADGDGVEISGVQGMTGLNTFWTATRIDDSTFRVPLVGAGQTNYAKGGAAQCGRDGCQVRVFTSEGGALRRLPSSTCVSERAGTAAFTEAAPRSGSWVGRNYPHSNNPCLSDVITPLSSNAASLKSTIDLYAAVGSTAGQIGIGWGWYMVSPEFGALWSGAGRPNAYDPKETLKVVILMTDGEFNNPYCQGVISQDAPNDGTAGNVNYQINCSPEHGGPFSQSVKMCEAMRQAGVVVYTVGFDLDKWRGPNDAVDTAIELMEACATNKDTHFFQPDNGTDLKEAFQAIGRDITRLRIAR